MCLLYFVQHPLILCKWFLPAESSVESLSSPRTATTTKTTPTMHCMSDDDAAYMALLTQLLSDPSSTRNAWVHSWIGHQYDFVLSEQNTDLPPASSRLPSPSPSPSSSLGAHHTFSIDRPDSPLLPRSSADGPSSPHLDACPSYDALFFPKADDASEDDQLEQRECERALTFIVQEMAYWKTAHSAPATPHKYSDKVCCIFFSPSIPL